MPESWEKPCHIHAVRCPHCGKPNDFREVGEALEDGGHPTVECDHCHGVMEVVKVQVTTLVWVRKWNALNDQDRRVLEHESERIVFQCPDCSAEFYGHGFKTTIDNQQICTCGTVLVRKV